MATYAIGDVQGCFTTLQALLGEIGFDPNHDTLWFAGDLVSRGPDSLACLRFVRSLGDRAVTVLGNHDLHLLAVAEGLRKPHQTDRFDATLSAPDCKDLLAWLRMQKLMYAEGPYVMVHAGLLPQWDVIQAGELAREVEKKLHDPAYRTLLEAMYGNQPDQWDAALTGASRLRVIINALTRLRVLTHDGRINFEFKGALDQLPESLIPWFAFPQRKSTSHTIIAGHWSALGLYVTPGFIGLDSGCVWGGKLTAVRLQDRHVFQVANMETVQAIHTD